MTASDFAGFRANQQLAARTGAPSTPGSLWEGEVTVAPTGSAAMATVRAINQATGDQMTLGAASWPAPATKTLPAVGDKCLVAVDEKQRPWIVAWLTPDWGIGGGSTALAKGYAGTTQTLSLGWSKIKINTATHDPGHNLDLPNHNFVTPEAGYYRITGQVALVAANRGSLFIPSIALNSSSEEESGLKELARGTRFVAAESVEGSSGGGVWVRPTLVNGWVHVAGKEWEYMRDGWGIVHHRGEMTSGTSNTVAFNLPEIFRPSTTETSFYLVVQNGAGAGAYLQVEANGDVKPTGPEVKNAVFGYGVSWPASPAFAAAGEASPDGVVTTEAFLAKGDKVELWVYNNQVTAKTKTEISPVMNTLTVSRIDSVLTPPPPPAVPVVSATAAIAYASSAEQKITSGVFNKIKVNKAISDPGGRFDLTNNRYVVPSDGIYSVSGNAALLGTVAEYDFISAVAVNGAERLRGTNQEKIGSGGMCDSVAGLISVKAGDFIELWVYQSSGTERSLQVPFEQLNVLCVTKVDTGLPGPVGPMGPPGGAAPLEWKPLSYAGTWASYGSEYAPAEYAKDEAKGIVHIRGLVKLAKVWVGGEPITLAMPVGFRPLHKEIFCQWGFESIGKKVAWRVDVTEGGVLTLMERTVGSGETGGEVAFLSLSGISFSVN